MKILFFLFLIVSSAFATEFDHWIGNSKIVDKHEFYKDNEVISAPKDTNQILFAVAYIDKDQKTKKDCLIYKVPGEELGKLKVKTINANDNCKDYLFQAGDKEWPELRSLQYSLSGNFISISITLKNFEIQRFDVPQIKAFTKKPPRMNSSSAEYNNPKVIYNFIESDLSRLKDGEVCQKVKEDCSLDGPSSCDNCENGWYEVPNGCLVGPKFCGYQKCGQRNAPACRRGMKFQLQDKSFHCSEDSSFAFCAKGLKVQCQGNLAYCI